LAAFSFHQKTFAELAFSLLKTLNEAKLLRVQLQSFTKNIRVTFLKHDKIGLEAAILLPTYVEHSAVKDLFKEIIGAGFYTVEACKTNNLNVKVYGESESLNLRPSEFDVDYVKLALGN
jgi:hypothetical protein